MNVAEQFGENLRRVRKRADLSQEALAIGASVHRTEISHLERGLRTARIDTVVKLAATLRADPGEFFEGMGWEPGGVRYGEFTATVETVVPGLGTVHRRVEVERRPQGKP